MTRKLKKCPQCDYKGMMDCFNEKDDLTCICPECGQEFD